jgi:hypothetical protein
MNPIKVLATVRWWARRGSPIAAATAASALWLLTAGPVSAHGVKHLGSPSPTPSLEQGGAPQEATPRLATAPQEATAPQQATSLQDSAAPGEAGPTQEAGAGEADEPGGRGREHRSRHDLEPGSACIVEPTATPSVLAVGAPFTMAGTLSCPAGVSAAEQTASLFQKTAGSHRFTNVATATTEADGAFQFALPGLERDSVFYVRCDGVKSARTHVDATGPQVAINGPANGTPLLLGPGQTAGSRGVVTFTGTVDPADPGARVILQREYRGGAWRRIAAGTVDAEGGFSISHRFRRRGTVKVRALVRFRGVYANTVSAPQTYQISRVTRAGESAGDDGSSS